MKIGLRVLLGYFVIVALAALLLGRVFVQQVKPGVRQAMEDTLVDTANVLAELATDDMLAGRINDGAFARHLRALRGRDIGAEIWGFPKREASYRITVTDARGIVVFDSAGTELGRDHSRWNDVYRTLRGQYGARSTRSDPDVEGSSVMYVAAPIHGADGRVAGVLTVSKPNRSMQPFIERSQQTVLNWGLLLLGVSLLIGLLAAWWLSRQLGSLRLYADAVTAGERVALPSTSGEFTDLGRALETMRDQLEGKQYVERYMHTLAHELKSPLAAIRASSELLEGDLPAADRQRFAASIGAQTGRMVQMIDKLLALASVEHRQRIVNPEPVAVPVLLQQVLEDAATRAQRVGVDMQLQADGPLPTLKGDPVLLRQMLDNLLDNAIDFSPKGGTVTLSAHAGTSGIVFEVLDQGPGIPDYARERVFERFYSLPRPATGARSSGLGLGFVREVVQLHGGTVALDNREGAVTGAHARIELPAEG